MRTPNLTSDQVYPCVPNRDQGNNAVIGKVQI